MAIRKVTGMHQREGSAMWWLRIIVPKPLQAPFYEGRTKLRMSLNTTDTEAARAAALRLHAEHAEKFRQQAAQLQPVSTMAVSTELADTLAARLRARILNTDDLIRFNPELTTAFLSAFATPPMRFLTAGDPVPEREPVSIDGLSPMQLGELTRIHEQIAQGYSSALTLGQWRVGESWAASELRQLGMTADWSKNRAAVLTVLRAVMGAWLEVGQRNLGQHSPTPPLPESPGDVAAASVALPAPGTSKGKLRTLYDVQDEWAVGQSTDAQKKMTRALKLLEESGSMRPLVELTRQDALNFRDHILRALPNRTAKTQGDQLSNIQTLLNFAMRERGYINANPWAGTAIAKGKRANRRTPWSDESLAGLFALPLWQSGQLVDRPKAGEWAAYWLPLLALHTGMRQAELCQLRVDDVRVADSVMLLDVNEAADELKPKSVKSEAGLRRVPVHQRLIQLGFADYLDDQRKSGAALLFDRLPSSATRSASDNFSDSFRELCQDAKVYQRWRDFHAFRTSVSTKLRGVYPALDESLIDAIMGHEGASVGRSHYTVHALRTLQRVVEHLQYPSVEALPRVYPSTAV